jgi:hypothetical protein
MRLELEFRLKRISLDAEKRSCWLGEPGTEGKLAALGSS